MGRKGEEKNTSMIVKPLALAFEYQSKSNVKKASMGENQMLYHKQREQSGSGSLKAKENWWEGRCEQTFTDRVNFSHAPV